MKSENPVAALDQVLGQGTVGKPFVDEPKVRTRGVDVFYGDAQAIYDVSLDIGRHQVIAMIGPSGCGKSTFLRALNRMNDTIPGCRVTGELLLDDEDIYGSKMDPVALRARVGMVFQSPIPFPRASTTTSPTAPSSTVWRAGASNSTRSWRPACARRGSGRR